MGERFTLITGRTRKQAIGLHKGKASPEYREATSYVEMSPDDMQRLGLVDGALVQVHSVAGSARLTARTGTVPSGLVFVPMGTEINALIPAETGGTGMPPFKGLEVDVSRDDGGGETL